MSHDFETRRLYDKDPYMLELHENFTHCRGMETHHYVDLLKDGIILISIKELSLQSLRMNHIYSIMIVQNLQRIRLRVSTCFRIMTMPAQRFIDPLKFLT